MNRRAGLGGEVVVVHTLFFVDIVQGPKVRGFKSDGFYL